MAPRALGRHLICGYRLPKSLGGRGWRAWIDRCCPLGRACGGHEAERCPCLRRCRPRAGADAEGRNDRFTGALITGCSPSSFRSAWSMPGPAVRRGSSDDEKRPCRTHCRPGHLPAHLQPSPMPHRTRRPTPDQPREQPCGSIHLRAFSPRRRVAGGADREDRGEALGLSGLTGDQLAEQLEPAPAR